MNLHFIGLSHRSDKFNFLFNKSFQASFLVAVSGSLYGFLGYFGTKIMQQDMSISAMLFWRFFVAGLWMLLFLTNNYLKTNSFKGINKKSLVSICIISAIGYAGASGFFFAASHYTGTGIAMVIFFSYPILVALYSRVVHKNPITVWTVFSLIAIAIGLALLRDSKHHAVDIIGILFALLSSVTYAFYVIGSKYFSPKGMDSRLLTSIVCFSCAAVFGSISIADHSFVIPHSMKTWTYIVVLGVIVTAAPIQLMLDGLKYISTLRASILSVLEPLVTVLVGIFLLNEAVTYLQILGIVIVLGSALLIQLQRSL